jgi:hypothetical protein
VLITVKRSFSFIAHPMIISELTAQTVAHSNYTQDEDNEDLSDQAVVAVKTRNEIRKNLKAAFKTVSVVCLPQPHPDVNRRSVTLAETTPEFQAAVNSFRADLAQRLLEPSVFGGSTVSAGLLKSILPALVDAVNNGAKEICPPTMMEAIHINM